MPLKHHYDLTKILQFNIKAWMLHDCTLSLQTNWKGIYKVNKDFIVAEMKKRYRPRCAKWRLDSNHFNKHLRNRQTSLLNVERRMRFFWNRGRWRVIPKQIEASPWIFLSFSPDGIVMAFLAADGVQFLCVIGGSRWLFLLAVSVCSLWLEDFL